MTSKYEFTGETKNRFWCYASPHSRKDRHWLERKGR